MTCLSMNAELLGHFSRSIKRYALFFSAAISLPWFVATPIQAADLREVDKVEGWSIVFDPAGDGACYARGTYGSNTSLSVGKIAPSATWVAMVSNSTLNPVQIDASYEIRYVFDKKYIWSEKAVGVQNGLRSNDMSDEFADDFARASALELFYSGRTLDAFKLLGTRAAVAAINQCYVFHTRKAAPYAASEPIETNPSP